MSNQLESFKASLQEQLGKLTERAQKTYSALTQLVVKATSSEDEACVAVDANGRHEVLIYFSAPFLKIFFPEASNEQLEQAAIELSKTATMTTNDAIQKINEISKEKLQEITADIDPNLLESADE